MCGICGIADNESLAIDGSRLERMRDLLTHRGPDDYGTWMGQGVGLGHRRLSIIDLQSGQQPLSNETNTAWVTFNGEIYNHIELRDELRRKGHHFRTKADTEVLIHGYEEWGTELPKRLNGIFAFGIYDTVHRRLLLARDHLGVKPLFYAVRGSCLAFASEVQSVLYALDLDGRPNLNALIEYLLFRYVAGAQSFYDGVNRLPAGHYALWEQGRLSVQEYWTPAQIPVDRGISKEDAVAEFDRRLSVAVDRQLMSDVPLGAFCSGGVDSGLTTYFAAGHYGRGQFRTYSVGVPAAAYDETALALTTARSVGAQHQTITCEASDVHAGLLSLLDRGGEPLSHPNMVPLLDLSRLARDGVTVVLTGEGADELFCGYPRYQIIRAHSLLSPAIRRAVGPALQMVPGHRAAKLRKALDWSADDAILFNSAFVDPSTVEALVGRPIGSALDRRRELLRKNQIAGDPIASISRYEMTTYLVSALERLDLVSMAVGLEARVPFLDIELVEWGLGLPSALKINGRTNKVTVKRAALGKLDPRIVQGRKSGFGLPLDEWFRGHAFASLMGKMAAGEHPAFEYLSAPLVHQIVREHLSGQVNHGELLWLLMNLLVWFDTKAAGRETLVA